jgi:hypothetical protein
LFISDDWLSIYMRGIDVARLIDRWRERRTTQISTSKNVETRTSSPLTYDYHATQHHAFIFDTRVNVSHSFTFVSKKHEARSAYRLCHIVIIGLPS